MATLSAFYVATEDPEPLIDALQAHAAEPGGGPVDSGHLDDDLAFYAGDGFFEALASRPRAFAIGVQQPGWVTAHVGAFEGVGELADALSAELDVRVVVAQGQTTSEAWRISVHEKGRTLRHIEFADGDWVVQAGTPLAFETQPLGTRISEAGEEPFYDFGFDEALTYCEELGFQFWSDRQPEDGWLWIRGGAATAPAVGGVFAPDGASDARRSWWRRWLGL